MKRIIKLIYSPFVILMIPFSFALGQGTKSEQKIRIVMDDGSGKKVILDTIYKDSPSPDSLKLKDGTVIFLKHPGDIAESGHHSDKDHVYVTMSTDGKDDGKESEDTFDVYVSRSDNDSTAEKTRFVIAKDGMVVTIEGNDEAKAKELAKDIESKLGINSEGTEKKETVTVESKKTIKK